MPVAKSYRPAPRHADLGPEFFDPVDPAPFPRHVLRHRNDRAAALVGLDSLTDAEWIAHFGRFEPLPDNMSRPLSLRYHGHQFRSYNPDLGDGRGFLFAQMLDDDERLMDLGTKGSGTTPWSRGGDGRLTLKGGVREILATEMLEALGVDTSRTFSVIETGEDLFRQDEPSPARSCVLLRLSHGHIRIGTFQRLAHLHDTAAIRRLLDHCVTHYFPELTESADADRAVGFLRRVVANGAEMVASWIAAGFVHGVMNTDNVNVTGESFDYGPWRFLPVFEPGFTAAYFDHGGLYAFGRQPDSIHWALVRLAECLLDIAPKHRLEEALDGMGPAFDRSLRAHWLRRMGLEPRSEAQDTKLMQACNVFLGESQSPYERLFYDWYGGLESEGRAAASPEARSYKTKPFEAVRALLADYRPRAGVDLSHPYFSQGAPCTMLIDEVEAIWAPIAEQDDWSVLEAKLADIAVMRDALAE